ncbi:hypothetical protein D3C81_1638960 [compost metagenome]
MLVHFLAKLNDFVLQSLITWQQLQELHSLHVGGDNLQFRASPLKYTKQYRCLRIVLRVLREESYSGIAVHRYPSLVRRIEASDDSQKSRFSRTIHADDTDLIVFFHAERGIFKQYLFPIAFR